jgi:hypothetical protein
MDMNDMNDMDMDGGRNDMDMNDKNHTHSDHH